MNLTLAKSKAGHDKNHIYVVVGETDDMVYLANGTTKTCESPKKKKKIHIQPIKHFDAELKNMFDKNNLNDETIAAILNLYQTKKTPVSKDGE